MPDWSAVVLQQWKSKHPSCRKTVKQEFFLKNVFNLPNLALCKSMLPFGHHSCQCIILTSFNFKDSLEREKSSRLRTHQRDREKSRLELVNVFSRVKNDVHKVGNGSPDVPSGLSRRPASLTVFYLYLGEASNEPANPHLLEAYRCFLISPLRLRPFVRLPFEMLQSEGIYTEIHSCTCRSGCTVFGYIRK
ncbi:hypothetical protein AVEN_150541-1 [Araneus ventricosus]|uniref:Uncharacterized protein n=1 Tax=Araneus ventricosus TaxID=182803 RepID=A0A4Y2E377_ARAVE|nr:hypothetical protein AVEN_150541-1 [Araneus ventricosus]